MTTLALSEHLEKIPYLLSIFLPVALFFLAGLFLAWLFWYKHARRLNQAIAEHDRLSADLSAGYQKKHDLGSRFKGLYEKHQEVWQEELVKREDKITSLNDDLSAETSRFADLDHSFNEYKEESRIELDERESKLGGLKSDLAKNVTALGLLQSKQDDGNEESTQLRSTVADLKKGNSDRDVEIKKLRDQVSKLEVSSAAVQTDLPIEGQSSDDFTRLQAELNAAKADKNATQNQLDQLTRDLEAEKNRKPEPAGAQAFFVNSNATKDEKLGFLYSSRPSKVDDLTKISGVGPVLQPKLNEFGVYQYKQVALWSQKNINAFSEKLDFQGRVEREQWVNQAADLHRENYGEHLAPVVDIFHKAPAVQESLTAPSPKDQFEGEPIKDDPKFGILFTSRPSEIDDLKLISGVAKVLEGKLHEIGLYRFKQIALWTDEQAADFSEKLAFPGRVERDEWVKQAKELHRKKYETP